MDFHGSKFFTEAKRLGWDGESRLGWERGNTSCSQCGAFFHSPVVTLTTGEVVVGSECQTCDCTR